MPSMFPTMASSSDDRNRRVESWQPGDPTPRTTIAAFALLLITGVLMIVVGGFQLMAKWDGPSIRQRRQKISISSSATFGSSVVSRQPAV